MQYLSDLKQLIDNASTAAELAAIADQADALFMADIPQLVMANEDWVTFNALLASKLATFNP